MTNSQPLKLFGKFYKLTARSTLPPQWLHQYHCPLRNLQGCAHLQGCNHPHEHAYLSTHTRPQNGQ